MNTQPEALRLAELFEIEDDPDSLYRQAAAELRRLHALNQELLRALKGCLIWMESLRASGDAGNWEWEQDDEYVKGIAAIAKAQGETK